jgi:hypothetical protein
VSRETAYARLIGAARLLPQPEAAADPESQRFIRTLWDLWWRESSAELPDGVMWRLHNLRPQNAPVRRLAAAACLFSGMFTVRHELDRLPAVGGTAWHAQALGCLTARCAWPFWNTRLTLASAPEHKETACWATRARRPSSRTCCCLLRRPRSRCRTGRSTVCRPKTSQPPCA